MCRELAKNALAGLVDSTMEFTNCTPHTFIVRFSAPPEQGRQLIQGAENVGLCPYLMSAHGRRHTVLIEVPDNWKPDHMRV